MNRPEWSLKSMLDADQPAMAMIIPVNAQGDLGKAMDLLEDLSKYGGANRFQILLVVDNYHADRPPSEALAAYRQLGLEVLSTAKLAGHPGIPPALRARMLALPQAKSRSCLFLDADCRIPNATGCLDWYVRALEDPAVKLAYTKVGHYNWPDNRLGMRVWLGVHYGWRSLKRNIMRVPTPRGSSYAMDRQVKQQLFDDGYLADETAIGRLCQAFNHRSVYTGRRECQVLTDGRMHQNARVSRLFTSYALRRLRINASSTFVGKDAASRTGRELDEAHKYDEEGRCV